MSDTNVRQLLCVLSPEEVDRAGRLLARKIADRTLKVEERKEKAKAMADEISEIDAEIERLSEAVNTGKERRPIPVSERKDNRRFCVETIRHDTLDVIETRAMSTEEAEQARQPSLFDERATAQSRDDVPPPEAALGTTEPPANDASPTEPAPPEAIDVPPPEAAIVTDPGALLSGKPDGTA